MHNSFITLETLHDKTTVPSGGEMFKVSAGAISGIIHVTTTSTDAVINFEHLNSFGEWDSIMGFRKLDLEMASSILATNSSWDVDLTALTYFRVRVSNISNGEISVMLRVVS